MNFGLKDYIITDLTNIFKKYPEIIRVCIFGSRAKGNYREASDIDISLFGENITDDIYTKIYSEIDALLLPYYVDLILFKSLKSNMLLRENILKDGVDIYNAR